jgi:hypothetical protein
MAVVRTYHDAYQTHYHIVFPVKYRKALLTNGIPLAISKIAEEIALRHDKERRVMHHNNYDYSLRPCLRSYPVGLPRGC